MIDEAPCPFGQCDGSGFVIDEDTRVASAVPLPLGAGRAPALAAAERGHPAQVPRRLLRPLAGDRHARAAGAHRAALRRRAGREPRRRPRAVAARPGRHGQDDARDARLARGARRGALGGDLLAAAPAGRDPRDLRGRRRRLLRLLPRPPGRGRPAARRRRGRREDVGLGARAALRDRQRALRGGALGRHHDEPRARSRWPPRSPSGRSRAWRRCARSCRSTAKTRASSSPDTLRRTCRASSS